MKLEAHLFIILILSILGLSIAFDYKLNKIQRDLEHVVVLMEEGICE